MSLTDWLISFVMIIIIVLFIVLIESHYEAAKMCSVVADVHKNDASDILNMKGIYTFEEIICFRADGNGINTLFHEMAHKQVMDDYDHFCEWNK